LSIFEVSKDASMFSSLRRREYVREGKYVRLFVGGSLMMSNTGMEKRTNLRIRKYAVGNVLIAGLGLGCILEEVLNNPNVKSVTVIEKYQDVIDLIAFHYQNEKLTIICADIFDWKPEKGQVFDTIYFDIWPDICTSNLVEIKKLHMRGRFWKNKNNPDAWMDSWMYKDLQSIKRREDKENWRYR
jgi:predicted membrane-bound spermidine synthase